MGEVHLAELVGICLNKYGNINISDSSLNTVFIAEVGKTDYYTVVLSAMCLEKISKNHALRSAFNSTVFYGVGIDRKTFNTGFFKGLEHIGSCAFNDRARKKASVCNQQC